MGTVMVRRAVARVAAVFGMAVCMLGAGMAYAGEELATTGAAWLERTREPREDIAPAQTTGDGPREGLARKVPQLAAWPEGWFAGVNVAFDANDRTRWGRA